MKNFFIKHVTLLLFVLTIPIQTKNSISNISSNISNKVRSLFKANTEEVTYQECKNIMQLEITSDHGPIVIDTWQQSCVFVELKKKGNDLFLKNTELKTTKDNHNLQVSTHLKENAGSGSLSLRILVPKDLPIKVTTTDKTITINNVSGPLELYSADGEIWVHQGDNTVIAKTVRGNIVIQRKNIKPNHALNVSSQHGNITLAVPQDINAQLEAHSQHGKIYSDLFVTMQPQTIILDEEAFKNMRRHVQAIIGQQIQNNDPATVLLTTDFGTIKICGHDNVPKKK